MSLIIIGAAAVLRTLAVVVLGAVSAPLMRVDSGAANSWLSTLNVYVFLPCLLIGHFSTTVSISVLQEATPLIIFGFLRILVGAATTELAALLGLLDSDTKPLSMLAVSSSNAVAIPLSILSELSNRVEFLMPTINNTVQDPSTGQLIPAQRYVETLNFAYALPINFAIWAVGAAFISRAAERLKKERAEAEAAKSAAQVTAAPPSAATTSTAVEMTEVATTPAANVAVEPTPATPTPNTASSASSSPSQAQAFFDNYILPSLTAPFISCITGIVLGLTVQDYLTGAAEYSGVTTALFAGIMLVGDAAVPGALIPVGITIYRTLSAGSETNKEQAEQKTTRQQQEQQQEQSNAPLSIIDRFDACLGVSSKLVLTVTTMQLIVVPAITFLVLVLGVYRSDFEKIRDGAVFSGPDADFWARRRLTLFALLLEAMCPSAMNTSIICTLYNYRDGDYSRMIVFQYICCVFTMAIFLSLNLWIIGA